MSLAVSLTTKDFASPALDRVRVALGTSGAVRKAMGRRVQQTLKAHFERLGAERHRDGVALNFYRSAATRVAARAPRTDGAGVTVDIPQQGIAQRYFGGDLVAGAGGSGKKWLTIASSNGPGEGRRAGEFSGLEFRFLGRGRDGQPLAALVSDDPSGRGRAELRGREGATRKRFAAPLAQAVGPFPLQPVIFWLKKRVNQRPDPTVLPRQDELVAAALAGAQDAIDAQDLVNGKGGAA